MRQSTGWPLVKVAVRGPCCCRGTCEGSAVFVTLFLIQSSFPLCSAAQVASTSEQQSPAQPGVCAHSPGVESRELFSDAYITIQVLGSCFERENQALLAALSFDEKLLLKLKETTGSKQTIGNMFQVAMLGAIQSFNICSWERKLGTSV